MDSRFKRQCLEHASASSANSATQSLINSLTNEPTINTNTTNNILNHLNQTHLQQNILMSNNQLQSQLVKEKTFQIIG